MGCKFPFASAPLGSWMGMLCITLCEGEDFAERSRGLKAAPHHVFSAFCFNNITKTKSKPAPKARERMSPAEPVAQGESPRAGLDPVHCQGNRGSDSTARKPEPAVSREHDGVHGGNGADYLQAAVWQCPLLALAHWQDNGTEQSQGIPVQGLHHHPGKKKLRFVAHQ